MIKECNVDIWNELIMVIDFDKVKVQMPSTENKEKSVYIKLENGTYSLSTKEEYDKSLVKINKKEIKSENNIKENIESI